MAARGQLEQRGQLVRMLLVHEAYDEPYIAHELRDIDVIRVCPAVEHLGAWGWNLLPGSSAHMHSLRHIHLGLASSDMLDMLPPSPVRSLRIEDLRLDDYDATSARRRIGHKHLETLELSVPQWHVEVALMPILLSFPNLQRFAVDCLDQIELASLLEGSAPLSRVASFRAELFAPDEHATASDIKSTFLHASEIMRSLRHIQLDVQRDHAEGSPSAAKMLLGLAAAVGDRTWPALQAVAVSWKGGMGETLAGACAELRATCARRGISISISN